MPTADIARHLARQARQPIGVFDSGLGGLTVVKALKRLLPSEDVVYFGDTARVPYGTKSRESIIRFSKENVRILLKYHVKMVVVACNSSSSHALVTLQRSFKLPIIGVIQPGACKAVAATRNNRIGVIATPATIKSLSYVKHLKKLRSKVRVINQACPLFVPLVEEGWYQKAVTATVAREYLSSIRKGRADTVILGCTHYPLLKPVLQKICGPKVVLVDSAAEVARNVKDLLDQKKWAHPVKHRGRHRFLVSDEPRHFQNLARRFLGYNIRDVKKVMPES